MQPFAAKLDINLDLHHRRGHPASKKDSPPATTRWQCGGHPPLLGINEVPMNEISMALLALLGLCLVVMIAPGILKMNKGKTLSKVAMWLAIVLALCLVYSFFGPGSKHPMLSEPVGMQTTPEGQPGAMAPPPPPPMPMPPAPPPAPETTPEQAPAPESAPAPETAPMPESAPEKSQ